jgi:peptide/nickel transport system substrate-binding protein
MKVARILTLAVIALLLLIVIIDRWRAPEQMRVLNETLGSVRSAMDQQTQEMRALRQTLASRPVTSTAPGDARPDAAAAVNDAQRDGTAKLGVNFLLPYDSSWFHPEWLRGTNRTFGDTAKGYNLLLDNTSTCHAVHYRVGDSLCTKWPATAQRWSEGLATSVVISDDYKTYTFTLRKGVKWQRPTIAKEKGYEWLDREVEMTAKDFVFTIDTIKNPEVECAELRNYYDDMEKAEALDDHTLRFVWKRKVYTSVASSLDFTPIPWHVYAFNANGTPIPKGQVGVAFNKHWFDEQKQVIGVGPYILDAFEPDKIMRFRRNPDYWGAPMHFENFEWLLDVKKPDPMLVAFKNAQVHAFTMPPAQFKSQVLDRHEPRFAAADPANPKAGREGELGWERFKRNSYYLIAWNLRSPLFADRRVRTAMAHAFPRDRIIKEVYYGLGLPVESDIHPDNDYAKGLNLAPMSFDLDRARALLKEAGWVDSDGDGWLDHDIHGQRVPLRFVIKYYADSPEWDNTLLIFKDELKKIGVDMKPDPKEWKELVRVYEDRDFEGVVGGWNDPDLEVDYYQKWHSSQAEEPHSSNYVGFKNARVDELADHLRTTFEFPERKRIAQEILTILHDEQPYVFFRSYEGITCWQNKGPPAKERYIDGMGKTLDISHPLYDRDRVMYRMFLSFRE